MTERRTYGFNIPGNNGNPLVSILIGVFFLVALYFVASFIFKILYYLSPLFLIAALIIDYKVVTGYVKWIANTFRQNIVVGIVATLLTVFGFPLVSAFLLGKAFLKKRIRQVEKEVENRTKGEEVEFEELESEPLRLPELEKERPQTKRNDNEYEELF